MYICKDMVAQDRKTVSGGSSIVEGTVSHWRNRLVRLRSVNSMCSTYMQIQAIDRLVVRSFEVLSEGCLIPTIIIAVLTVNISGV